MNPRTILGTLFTLAGLMMLVYALVEVFDSATGGLTKGSTWIVLILGLVLFPAGIKLLVAGGK